MKKGLLLLLLIGLLVVGCGSEESCKADCEEQDMSIYKYIHSTAPKINAIPYACWCIPEDSHVPLKIW